MKTIESNSLIEHRARRRDRIQGRLGSATLPSKSGLTAVANEAAPHQTDADAAAARASSSSDLIMVETDANEIDEGSTSLIDFDHGYDDDNDGISVDATACDKCSNTNPTTATGDERRITTSPIFYSGSSAPPTARATCCPGLALPWCLYREGQGHETLNSGAGHGQGISGKLFHFQAPFWSDIASAFPLVVLVSRLAALWLMAVACAW